MGNKNRFCSSFELILTLSSSSLFAFGIQKQICLSFEVSSCWNLFLFRSIVIVIIFLFLKENIKSGSIERSTRPSLLPQTVLLYTQVPQEQSSLHPSQVSCLIYQLQQDLSGLQKVYFQLRRAVPCCFLTLGLRLALL